MPSADSPPPRRKRRWLRRLTLLCAVFLLLLGAAVLVATRNLTTFARWAMERAFPGATVELSAVDFTLPGQLDVRSLVLKSRKDGEVLLSLAGGTLAFDFTDLRHRRIGEVRLVEPVLYASPRLGEAFVPPPGTNQNLPPPGTNQIPPPPGTNPQAKPTGAPWSVRRLVCDYGELIVSGYGPSDLVLRSKFSFDFRDFSPAQSPQTLHAFTLWDVSATTGADPAFLTLDVVEGAFTFEDLLKKRTVSTVNLKGGHLAVGESLRRLFAAPKDPAALPQDPWVLGTLDIRGVAVTVDDDRPEITDITFALNTKLKNLPLAQTASALGSEPQSIIVWNLEILSPRDPLTKVVTLRRTEFTFTLAGLLRRELAALEIREPTIHIGQDLFWYMEDAQKRLAPVDPAVPTEAVPGWKIGMLYIHGGRLMVGSSGRREYGLPLNFYAYAEDIELDNLTSLRLQTALEIPEQKYSFPDYQLEFTGGGTLRFSYPPEKQEKNLVGEVGISSLRWRQYQASDCFVAVTFDQIGINGEFGGGLYQGRAGGGFSFFFDPASPWIGWVWGLKIDLRRLTNILSPQNFQMTGPLDFKLQMDARGKAIERIVGELKTPKPGKMVIKKLDDMLARIPPTWNLLKQSSTRLALEALRDFKYDKGSGKFWFVNSQGILQLKLQGPQGSRTFDVVLHSDDTPQGRWKKRTSHPSE